MKKILAVCLTAILLMGCVTALADTWYCPQDGTACDSNFCPVCGTRRPDTAGSGGAAPANDIAMTSAVLNSDGSVSFSWSGGKAPYNLYYAWYVNDQHNNGSDVNIVQALSALFGNSVTMSDQMVPGERYWVVVQDADGAEMWYDFNPGQRVFTALPGTRLKLSLRTKRGNRSSTVNGFSANEIEREYLNSLFGGTVKLVLGSGGVGFHFVARMALMLPNGEPILFHVEEATSHWQECGWETWDFKNAWARIMNLKNTIPAGQYTFRMYLNDCLFGQEVMYIN